MAEKNKKDARNIRKFKKTVEPRGLSWSGKLVKYINTIRVVSKAFHL